MAKLKRKIHKDSRSRPSTEMELKYYPYKHANIHGRDLKTIKKLYT